MLQNYLLPSQKGTRISYAESQKAVGRPYHLLTLRSVDARWALTVKEYMSLHPSSPEQAISFAKS